MWLINLKYFENLTENQNAIILKLILKSATCYNFTCILL